VDLWGTIHEYSPNEDFLSNGRILCRISFEYIRKIISTIWTTGSSSWVEYRKSFIEIWQKFNTFRIQNMVEKNVVWRLYTEKNIWNALGLTILTRLFNIESARPLNSYRRQRCTELSCKIKDFKRNVKIFVFFMWLECNLSKHCYKDLSLYSLNHTIFCEVRNLNGVPVLFWRYQDTRYSCHLTPSTQRRGFLSLCQSFKSLLMPNYWSFLKFSLNLSLKVYFWLVSRFILVANSGT